MIDFTWEDVREIQRVLGRPFGDYSECLKANAKKILRNSMEFLSDEAVWNLLTDDTLPVADVESEEEIVEEEIPEEEKAFRKEVADQYLEAMRERLRVAWKGDMSAAEVLNAAIYRIDLELTRAGDWQSFLAFIAWQVSWKQHETSTPFREWIGQGDLGEKVSMGAASLMHWEQAMAVDLPDRLKSSDDNPLDQAPPNQTEEQTENEQSVSGDG